MRAVAARSIGDRREAARWGLMALPTGAPPIDEALAAVCAEGAWEDARKLSRFVDGCLVAGFGAEDGGETARLLRLAEIKLARRPEAAGAEAEALAALARMLGDAGLAKRIDEASRRDPGGYR